MTYAIVTSHFYEILKENPKSYEQILMNAECFFLVVEGFVF